jgi:hypothetical protein
MRIAMPEKTLHCPVRSSPVSRVSKRAKQICSTTFNIIYDVIRNSLVYSTTMKICYKSQIMWAVAVKSGLMGPLSDGECRMGKLMKCGLLISDRIQHSSHPLILLELLWRHKPACSPCFTPSSFVHVTIDALWPR